MDPLAFHRKETAIRLTKKEVSDTALSFYKSRSESGTAAADMTDISFGYNNCCYDDAPLHICVKIKKTIIGVIESSKIVFMENYDG